MFKTHVLGQSTLYSCMSDGRERFLKCCEFSKEHGRFPKPVILEEKMDRKIAILDGNHRLTAYFYLYGFFNIESPDIPYLNIKEFQEYWVARL